MMVGMDNGALIRIIVPAKVWLAILEELDCFDDFLKGGIRNFLCADEVQVNEDSKPIFFEKILGGKTESSDLVYGMILIRFIDRVIRERFSDIKCEEWEVRLPYAQDGYYLDSKFKTISPPQIEQYKEICSDVNRAWTL